MKTTNLQVPIAGPVTFDSVWAIKEAEGYKYGIFPLENVKFGFELAVQYTAFQPRVGRWMLDCFAPEIADDKMERNHRFFEEAAELVQAGEMTRSEAHQLVDYVYDRPVGEKHQEVGGVMVTLAAWCRAQGLNMHECGEIELARIDNPFIREKIRIKQANKPKHSPLPEA